MSSRGLTTHSSGRRSIARASHKRRGAGAAKFRRYTSLGGMMHSNTRALVAAAAARIIGGGGNVGAIYDFSRSRHIQLSGTVSDSNVSLYDYDRGCHFSGPGGSFYDYGRGCHVSLQVNGNSFSGYDFGDGQHFSGTVNGSSVSVYDYGESSHFNYSV